MILIPFYDNPALKRHHDLAKLVPYTSTMTVYHTIPFKRQPSGGNRCTDIMTVYVLQYYCSIFEKK